MAEQKNASTEMTDTEDFELEELKPQSGVDNEEFKKVFARPFAAPEPSHMTPPTREARSSHYDYNFSEKDYKSRRKTSTNYHEPLRRIHSRSSKLSSMDKTDGGTPEHKRRSREGTVQVLPRIKEGQVSHDDYEKEKENQGEQKEESTTVGEGKHRHRHHSRHHKEHKDRKDHKDGKDHKDQKDNKDHPDRGEKPYHHRHHHRHHHHTQHRTISEREQLESRLRSGAVTLREIEPIQDKLATEKDEASFLGKRDLEEMAWHRFEDLRGLRRRRPHLPRHKSGMKTHFSSTDISASLQKFPVKYDHSPHEAFIELEELTMHGEEMEWKETARWIKYEENVEDSNRWGKPHVASLTFHSLLELRKGLGKGTVLFDLEKFDLPSIAEAVVENMVITDQLSQMDSNKVLAALLLRHRHQHQLDPIPRRPSAYNLLALGKTSSKPSLENEDTENRVEGENQGTEEEDGVIRLNIDDDATENIPLQEISQLPLASDDKQEAKGEVTFAPEPAENSGGGPTRKQSEVRSRIPEGAEATTVLVGTLDELQHSVLAFVRLAKGCHLGNITEVSIPVRFLFVLLGPTSNEEAYHEIGRSIATLMSDQAFHDLAYRADSREDLLSAINEFLDDTVVLPPGEWDRNVLLPILIEQSRAMVRRKKMAKAALAVVSEEEDPLERTGHFCGGLIKDVKRKAKFYLSDFKDGLNLQCIMASIFLYFAVFAPNVAFGGLLEEKTDRWLGVSEVIFATCLCGILFGLIAGQPLIIIGATGPVLVFEQSIYQFCQTYQVEFLPWRCWIGFWVMIILFGVVACEGCFLVHYFTRFTEEIFACLISAIFIYEAIHFLEKVFKHNPLRRVYPGSTSASESQEEVIKEEPNTALLSTILVLGTFFVAFYLRKFRTSYFFGKKARRLVSDFGIAIAMVCMVVLDIGVHDKVVTPKISIGDPIKQGFSPTRKDERGWFINPGGMKKSMEVAWVFAAIIPALFVGILLFMETELTGVLLNKKEHKLSKGPGFNLDLVIMGCLSFICSLMGLPWMCAATVRSVSHLNALSVWSTSHAPGEKPYLIEVKEQRVTNIAIHVLHGFSILLAPALHLIPVPVMFGVLLYLGVCSLAGIQLVDRLIMMFMPHKYHPDVQYVRKVRTTQIHWFTGIQLVCLAILIGVKLTVLAPSFPFFIICLIPLRKSLSKFFEEQELEELDNEEPADDDSDLDEYDSVFHPL